MKKIVTMGEIMLRLSTKNNEKMLQANDYSACFGGSEANVAVSLSCLGNRTSFVTKLPNNPLGNAAEASLKKYGVDTQKIAWGGERLGLYFLEPGSSYRPSNVVYDRANSAMSEATADDFDFDSIWEDADWFHISGITPAISSKAFDLTLKAVKSAKKKRIMVSCDLNYRSKLWSVKKAREVMIQIMEYVDVCITGREDAITMLGFELLKRNDDDTPNIEAYSRMFEEMVSRYGFKYVACSIRRSFSASDNELSGLLYDGKNLYQSKTYRISPMVDRVGGGDAFAAGIIHTILDNRNPQDIVDFGVATSVLKHTIPGDYNLVNEEEVKVLMDGNSLGRVSR